MPHRFFGLWHPIYFLISNNKIYIMIITFNKYDNLQENNKMKFSVMKIFNGKAKKFVFKDLGLIDLLKASSFYCITIK